MSEIGDVGEVGEPGKKSSVWNSGWVGIRVM